MADPTLESFPLLEGTGYRYQDSFTSQHHGVDIFAPLGTAVLAVRDGNAVSRIEPKGGRVVYLTADDGTKFFYAHLQSWELPVMRPNGARVLAGEPIGTVGTSGNAVGKSPHLHFQIRLGSLVVDPLPHLVAVDTDPNKPALPAKTKGPIETFMTGFGTGAGSAIAIVFLLWALSKR